MKIVLFGASGMVGQGVLQECLRDSQVQQVISVGRAALEGAPHPKHTQLVCADLFDIDALQPELLGADACFFCLGVSSAGLSEAQYRRLTYDLTVSVAERLARWNPAMTFVYVSGMGTDSTSAAKACGRGSRERPKTRCCACPSRRPTCSGRA